MQPQAQHSSRRLRPLVAALAAALVAPALAAPESLPLKAERYLHVPPVTENGALFLRADEIRNLPDDVVEAQGKVEIRARAQTIEADFLRYSANSNEVYGKGDVFMRNSLNTISGPEVFFRRDAQTGYFHQPTFEIGLNASRVSASELIFSGPDRYKLNDARYSTCTAADPAWYLRTIDLDIDQSRQVGTAHNAFIYFQSTPILWSPWADFPLDNHRKSGLLAPSFGSTGNRGLEITLPFYWNIAPNYDATITTRVMSKRGVQLGSEFRYLEPTFFGDVELEDMPHDQATNTDRYLLVLHHTENILPNLHFGLNLNKVSDDNYFVDLADRIAMTSQTVLPRSGFISYNLPYVDFTAQIQKFQTLQDPNAPIMPPYERVPQLVANSSRQDWHGFDLSASTEYDRFTHPTLITGQRLTAYPSISYPWRNSAFFVTPKFGYHMSRYLIDADSGNLLDTTRSLFINSTRTVPITSLDTGVVFERDLHLFGSDYVNTLEPRLFYLYVPYRRQDEIPIFDSAIADFNFAQLFAENRYIGQDRIGDAKQVTFAITSRLLEPDNGNERLRIAMGQRYYFDTQKVTLNEPLRTETRSDFLFTANGRIDNRWLLDSGVEYNPYAKQTERLNFSVRFQKDPGKTLSLGYRYIRELLDASGNPTQIKEIDLAGQWPLYGNWYAEARYNFSFFDHKVLEALGGLEYNGGCWVFRILGQRIATTTQTASNSIFFQLELNGLGSLGTNPLEALRRNIPNYFKVNEPVHSTEAPGQWYQPKY